MCLSFCYWRLLWKVKSKEKGIRIFKLIKQTVLLSQTRVIYLYIPILPAFHLFLLEQIDN